MVGTDTTTCIQSPHHGERVELGQSRIKRSRNEFIGQKWHGSKSASLSLGKDEVDHNARDVAVSVAISWVRELWV